MNVSEKLVQLGFSPNQALVYSALVEMGNSKAAAIIKQTSLHRSIVYEALDALEKRRLIFKTSQGGVSWFQLSDANSLVSDAEMQLANATAIANEINVLRERSGHEVKFYEGMNGLTAHRDSVLRDLKDDHDEHYIIAGKQSQAQLYEQFFQAYDTKRAELELPAKILFSQSDAVYADKVGSEPFTQARLLPQNVSEPTMIDIWKDNVAFMMYDIEPFVVSIHNKQLAQSFREYFQALWNQDVKTYRGIDGLKAVMEESLKYKDHWFIGGNAGIADVMPDYWEDYNARRIEKGIWWHDLVDAGTRLKGVDEGVQGVRNEELFVEWKELSPEVSSPMVVLIYGETVAHIHWHSQYAFVIEDAAVAHNYKQYFQYLWNQDVYKTVGLHAAQDLFYRKMRELQPGDEYVVLWGSYGNDVAAEMMHWFGEYHRERIGRGIHLRITMQEADRANIVREMKQAGDTYLEQTGIRFTTSKFHSPMQMNIYPDSIVMFYWGNGDDALAIEIRKPEIRDAMMASFEGVWATAKK
jgi:sugar-specific transcriptional regulator TrmB